MKVCAALMLLYLIDRGVYSASLHELVWVKYGGGMTGSSDLEKYIEYYTAIQYENRKRNF